MKGRERIKVVDAGTPRLVSSIPALPEEEAVLVRRLRLAAAQMADTFEPSLPPSALAELIGASRPNLGRILRDPVKAGHIAYGSRLQTWSTSRRSRARPKLSSAFNVRVSFERAH